MPVLTKSLFPMSLAIKKGKLWSQIHMFYVSLHGFPVNSSNKPSLWQCPEQYRASPTISSPQISLCTSGRNDCFELLSSSRGCNFPEIPTLSVPNKGIQANNPAGICLWPPLNWHAGPRWDQRYRFRRVIYGGLSHLRMCSFILLFANTELPSFKAHSYSFSEAALLTPTFLPMPVKHIKDPW